MVRHIVLDPAAGCVAAASVPATAALTATHQAGGAVSGTAAVPEGVPLPPTTSRSVPGLRPDVLTGQPPVGFRSDADIQAYAAAHGGSPLPGGSMVINGVLYAPREANARKAWEEFRGHRKPDHNVDHALPRVVAREHGIAWIALGELDAHVNKSVGSRYERPGGYQLGPEQDGAIYPNMISLMKSTGNKSVMRFVWQHAADDTTEAERLEGLSNRHRGKRRRYHGD